ncbi:serine/threonine kinase [Nostoc sp. NIES-2111]|nr:serine/threonine kinase [Nostoc sp. NIES-2111]
MNAIVGQKLSGRYQILQQIGTGGFGITFLAEDMQRPGNPKCVVKQLQPISNNPYVLEQARRLFNKEAEILETLGNHAYIPRLLAHFEDEEEFYLVQEYIEGHDLSRELLPGKKLSEPYVLKLLQDILEILIFVHHHGVVHRDIKPSNIIRKQDGKIVLIDFGSVKQISTQIVTSEGQEPRTVVVGTMGYMPSEQANGQPNFTSDIYAVGIIGIQALTGIKPEQLPKDTSTGEIIWRNQAQVSQELADILDKMVRYYFLDRFQSAEAALQSFRALIPTQITPVQSLNAPSASSPTLRSPNNFIPKLSLAVLAGVILIFSIFITPITKFISSRTETFLTYENSTEKLKIKYPQSWNRQDINNRITGELVTFISPKQNESDDFQEKLTITIEDFPGTLQEFTHTSIKDINNNLVDAKIINTSEQIVTNKQGEALVYQGKDGNKDLKNLQVFTLKSGKAYVITYTAKVDNYNDFLDVAEIMIKSLEIQ